MLDRAETHARGLPSEASVLSPEPHDTCSRVHFPALSPSQSSTESRPLSRVLTRRVSFTAELESDLRSELESRLNH